MKTILLVLIITISGILVMPVFAETFSYSPLRESQTPWGPYPTGDEIAQDMKDMESFGVDRIRIFETGALLETIMAEAEKNGIRVMVGIYVDADPKLTHDIIKDTISRTKNFKNVDSYIVGNNPIFHGITTVDQLIQHIDFAKAQTSLPVTSINGYDYWRNDDYDKLASSVDFIFMDAFTNNQDLPQNQAAIIKEKFEKISKEHPTKRVYIETGWSTVGSSKLMQNLFVSNLNHLQVPFTFFEWADESWKENNIESGFGFFKATREGKPIVESPILIEKPEEDPDLTNVVITTLAIGASIATGVYGYKHFTGRSEWGHPIEI